MLEAALSQYLNVLKGNFVDFDSVNESAPMPVLAFLKQAGVPLRDVQENKSNYSSLNANHRKLVSILLGTTSGRGATYMIRIMSVGDRSGSSFGSVLVSLCCKK